MAKRFLVPLDRTPVAESVLPLVADAARSAGATVRLVHVASMPGNVSVDGRVIAYADQEMDRLDAEHGEYLRALAAAHFGGVATECVVRFGEPAEEILREADAFGADAIAVATRSRSSLSRALLGSVAEALVHKAPVTVVLVRPAL